MSPDQEFDSLRDELLQLTNRQLNLVTFTLTVSVILIGFAINNSDGVIVLAPLILLAFLLNQQVATRRGIQRISTYISCCLEAQSNYMGWETRVNQLRKKSLGNPVFRDFGSTQPAFALLPIVTGIVCIIVSYAILMNSSIYFLLWILPSIALVFWIGYSISIFLRLRLAESDNPRNEYVKAWEDILTGDN
ncbi:MAG: hypothetical protein R3C14_12390 [Caldilineaceae bacterium]